MKLAWPQICFCESGYSPWPPARASCRRSAILGLGSLDHCHQVPLAPGFRFVQPKEGSREMRKPGGRKSRDGSRPRSSLFLLRPDLTASLQRSSTSFAGLTEVPTAGSCATAIRPPAVHPTPLLPTPMSPCLWSCWADASVRAPLSTGKTASSPVFPSPRDGSCSCSD